MTDAFSRCDHSVGCSTCADEAVAMQVIEVDAAGGLALCAAGGAERCTVETALVEPVVPGERLLVHAGTAIGRAAR